MTCDVDPSSAAHCPVLSHDADWLPDPLYTSMIGQISRITVLSWVTLRMKLVEGAAGKWLLFEPFLSLLKFLLPQSSEQADSCKHWAPVWGEGGAPGSRNVNIKVKSCLRMQKLHDIETSI